MDGSVAIGGHVRVRAHDNLVGKSLLLRTTWRADAVRIHKYTRRPRVRSKKGVAWRHATQSRVVRGASVERPSIDFERAGTKGAQVAKNSTSTHRNPLGSFVAFFRMMRAAISIGTTLVVRILTPAFMVAVHADGHGTDVGGRLFGKTSTGDGPT